MFGSDVSAWHLLAPLGKLGKAFTVVTEMDGRTTISLPLSVTLVVIMVRHLDARTELRTILSGKSMLLFVSPASIIRVYYAGVDLGGSSLRCLSPSLSPPPRALTSLGSPSISGEASRLCVYMPVRVLSFLPNVTLAIQWNCLELTSSDPYTKGP